MTIFLALLQKWWKPLAIILIIGLIYGYWHHLESTISDQRTEIATLNTANTILKQNNDKLTTSIADINVSVGKLAEGTSQTQASFATLNATVKVQTGSLDQKLRAVLADKKPQSCDDTIRYLVEAAKGYQK